MGDEPHAAIFELRVTRKKKLGVGIKANFTFTLTLTVCR